MSAFYDFISAGADPVSLADMKTYLKDPPSVDDALITSLIALAVEYGQKYTGREFTDNTWKLLLDAFDNPIILRRSPVNSITTIKYLVSGTLTTVADTVYWLKELTQTAEIRLDIDQEWPTDIDDRQQGVEIIFVTKIYARCAASIDAAIKRHVTHLYENRGDCDVKAAGKASGVDVIYNQFRISRV